jgi:ubiquinone/menaquinone biosynthesis C-methylase UbiE
MGWYGDQVLPRIVNVALGTRECTALRQRVAPELAGEVLEVGFGSGLNVPYYSDRVERVLAVDPATVGRKLAAERVASSAIPIDYVGLDGAHLPLDDESVDCVLSTWTLCTIPDVNGALAEIHRVLRPGGRFHFLEHGRSPEGNVAKWQDRLDPIQQRLFGGCHLNRQIDQLVGEAGLHVGTMDNFYMRGPKPLGYMFEGVAAKQA